MRCSWRAGSESRGAGITVKVTVKARAARSQIYRNKRISITKAVAWSGSVLQNEAD